MPLPTRHPTSLSDTLSGYVIVPVDGGGFRYVVAGAARVSVSTGGSATVDIAPVIDRVAALEPATLNGQQQERDSVALSALVSNVPVSAQDVGRRHLAISNLPPDADGLTDERWPAVMTDEGPRWASPVRFDAAEPVPDTPALQPAPLEILSVSTPTITTTSISVDVSMDRLCDARLEAEAPDGTELLGVVSFGRTSHSLTISILEPDTSYVVRVLGDDARGNVDADPDAALGTLTTLAGATGAPDRTTLAAPAYAKGTHATSTLALPDYLTPTPDPTFGGILTRVSDDAGVKIDNVDARWTIRNENLYSTTPVWNSDDTRMLVRAVGTSKFSDGSGAPEWIMLDGTTYAPIAWVYPVSPSGSGATTEMRWHPVSPDTLICACVTGEVYLWDVTTDSATAIVSLGETVYFGAYQGNASHDGRYIVATNVAARNTQPVVARLIDTDAKQVVATHTFTDPDTDTISVSASGGYIWWNGALTPGQYDRTRIHNASFTALRTQNLAGAPSHYDTGFDATGREVIVGVDKPGADTPVFGYGRVMTYDLATGAIDDHTDAGEALHTSARCIGDPGYAWSSMANNSGVGHLRSEIVRVKLDGSMTYDRLCHHRSTEGNDTRQPHACPNGAGDRAAFTTDWGVQGGPIHAFVVQYPGS